MKCCSFRLLLGYPNLHEIRQSIQVNLEYVNPNFHANELLKLLFSLIVISEVVL